MNRLGWLIGLALLVPTCELTAQGYPEGRTRTTINDRWVFRFDESERWSDDFIQLPHTWNAKDGYDKEPGYHRAVGVYRRPLHDLEFDPDRRYFVYFEGVNQVATVFMNGIWQGQHIGGYTAFAIDISGVARPNGPNDLVVYVDNSHDPDIPPLDADFTFFGGIYRDVWLISTANTHIDVTEHASPGVFVDLTSVSDREAVLSVRTDLRHWSSTPIDVDLRLAVYDSDQLVVESTSRETLPPMATYPAEVQTLTTTGLTILEPHRWSPDDPHLYRVVAEVIDGERLLDRVEVPLGIRTFSVDGDGFYLNGERLRLNGTNRHQDYPGYGNAVPDWVHRRDVKIIKDDGFNFLRLAHYPQDPAVLEETDRLGLIVWEEIPVVNIITQSDAFKRNAETMLVEMIRQHYNHPSIVMWGYMNEVMLRKPDPVPEGYYEDLLALTEHLEEVTKTTDPSRLTATAQSYVEIYNGKGVSDVTDILGFNLYFGWYHDTPDSLGPFLDRIHMAHPDRPLLLSEYGAGSDERIHANDPKRFDFSSDHAQNFHAESFLITNNRPYLVGTAVWNQFDFGSAGRQDSKNAINQKGLYFHDRTPKDIAWYYRAALREEQVVHIADEWSSRAGSSATDAEQTIRVYSNADSVMLEVNGFGAGWREVSNYMAEWKVDLSDGRNRITAFCYPDDDFVCSDRTEIHYHDRAGLFTLQAQPGDYIAVNVGAEYDFVRPDGVVFSADRSYSPGSWGHLDGTPRLIHRRIIGTEDDPLHQTYLDDLTEYRFDVPDGLYDVELWVTVLDRERRLAADGKYVDRAEGGAGLVIPFGEKEYERLAGILIRRK